MRMRMRIRAYAYVVCFHIKLFKKMEFLFVYVLLLVADAALSVSGNGRPFVLCLIFFLPHAPLLILFHPLISVTGKGSTTQKGPRPALAPSATCIAVA